MTPNHLIITMLLVTFRLTAQSGFCSFGGQITEVSGNSCYTGEQMLTLTSGKPQWKNTAEVVKNLPLDPNTKSGKTMVVFGTSIPAQRKSR